MTVSPPLLLAGVAVAAVYVTVIWSLCRASAAAEEWQSHVDGALDLLEPTPEPAPEPVRATARELFAAREAQREAAIRRNLTAREGDLLVALDRDLRGSR